MLAWTALATLTAAVTFAALCWALGWRVNLHHLDSTETLKENDR